MSSNEIDGELNSLEGNVLLIPKPNHLGVCPLTTAFGTNKSVGGSQNCTILLWGDCKNLYPISRGIAKFWGKCATNKLSEYIYINMQENLLLCCLISLDLKKHYWGILES